LLWHRQNLNSTSFAIALTLCSEIRGQTFALRRGGGDQLRKIKLNLNFDPKKYVKSHSRPAQVLTFFILNCLLS